MRLTAACAFGLEAIVKRELISLGFEPKVEQPGRISFNGDWGAVAKANLWLRTADRILIEVLKFPAPDFDTLFETVKSFDWSELIPEDAKFPVTGRSRLSQLSSVPAVQRSVKRAVVESLKRYHGTSLLPEDGPLYKVDVALLKDEATLTIDTTGPSLHKRGYRKLIGAAPIKETMAAALVTLSVWNPERMLVDPFCGTGTIPIEAALIGLNIAPGLQRDFSFSQWSNVPSSALIDARHQAHEAQRDGISLQITGTDIDDDALEMARFHARKAGVADQIHFQQKAFVDFRSKREYGCMVTNPPYGERLEETEELLPLYKSIPMVFQRVPTWSLFVLTNKPRLEAIVQKTATRRRKLFNGRIECTYFQFLGPRPPRDLPKPDESHDAEATEESSSPDDAPKREQEKSPPPSKKPPKQKVAPVFGGLRKQDYEQAELFQNRLQKRARHLRRWPSRRNINCYRLYERDVPEIPLVVDRYADALHITRYDRPHDRDLARDAAWLELMQKTAAAALEIPIHRVFVKKRQEELQQHAKVDSVKKMFEVQEGELKFLVNLTDYIDTGLFLDHRNLRQTVGEQAAGQDFLNLFAYTGSFSVYAAQGGAKSTTTVDLSGNYLDWAQKNMHLNQLESSQHRFIAEDAIEFLQNTARNSDRRYDLAVVDPPTFSNSKKTNRDWDVQLQHAELLRLTRLVMRPQGVVYFSTNFRRFKLDVAGLSGYKIQEISKQTVPEDFRNKRIHRSWRLEVID
ncbi:MAG: bifunctional 23S rRNA (guanine(2069)-N(7))-methyltransferase RlmK/23S rRNA (guanine(2445)-N(2))-methyltransferase RlmL [Pirellulaceae bacterium]|nr:bifunctional 23S rRNA (guanine(2069)-N(7))-methyltransferase RlmK/23S rRNA (guanine(2445)-N(2))-methyltransferase RlmL [Pirellulaceae bacterium]